MSSIHRKLFPYAIVILLAFIGFSLPLPILPEMFLDPELSILPAGYSLSQKTALLGIMMGSFPLGQLIGSPILGRFSDQFGRKRVILFSLLGSTLGYVITALGVSHANLWMLFIGLWISGFAEGNISIAQSVIADLTREKGSSEKVFHFGFINVFVCLGFIIGPLIGGQLADRHLGSWFTFATPFWIAAALTIVGFLIIAIFSEETRSGFLEMRAGFFESLRTSLRNKKLRILYLVNFFLALCYFSYFRFFPVYLQQRFDFSSAMLAYAMVYSSLIFAITTGGLVGPLSKKWPHHRTAALFALLLALTIVAIVVPSAASSLWWTIPPVGVCLAVVITLGSVIVSDSASDAFQGQALGVLTSVQVLAEFLTGVYGGVLAGWTSALPLVVGAGMSVVASLILITSGKHFRKVV